MASVDCYSLRSFWLFGSHFSYFHLVKGLFVCFADLLYCIKYISFLIWRFNRTVPPTNCKVDINLAGFLVNSFVLFSCTFLLLTSFYINLQPIYSMTTQQRLAAQFSKKNFDDFKKYAPEVNIEYILLTIDKRIIKLSGFR